MKTLRKPSSVRTTGVYCRPTCAARLLRRENARFYVTRETAEAAGFRESVGDTIRIKGHTTDITQKVESMQIEHQPVQTASARDSVGIKVADRVRRTNVVHKI